MISSNKIDYTFRPVNNEIIKITTKTKNKIFAMPVTAPAIPPNPNTPAIIAMIRKTNDTIVIVIVTTIIYNFNLIIINFTFKIKNTIKAICFHGII